MTTAHAGFQFVAGDDWEIRATLLDENGAPYDLATATIKWGMFGSGSSTLPVIGEGAYSLSIIDADSGTCSIKVLAAKTTTIKGGQYHDALRIISGGVTSTLSTGIIYVTDDPWAATQAAMLKVVA